MRTRIPVDFLYIQGFIVAYVLDVLCVLQTALSFLLMVTLKTFVGLITTLIILLVCKNKLGVPLGGIIVDAVERAVQ